MFSELQLYRPFCREEDLYPEDLENCQRIYDEISEHNRMRKITNVKRILMKHLESVEEASERVEEQIKSRQDKTMLTVS